MAEDVLSTGGVTTFKGTTTEGCQPRARLFVESTELPLVGRGIETHVRKNGASDIQRRTEAYIPYDWGGQSVVAEVDGLSGGPEPRQYALVEVYDKVLESYVPVHSGRLGGAGAANDPETARIVIDDEAQALSRIPANKTFKNHSLFDLLKYVKDTYAANQDYYDSLQFALLGQDVPLYDTPLFTTSPFDQETFSRGFLSGTVDFAADSTTSILKLGAQAFDKAAGLFGEKTQPAKGYASPARFQPNRDTLADVLDWAADRLDAWWYFAPTRDFTTPRLVFDLNPTTRTFYGPTVDIDAVEEERERQFREEFEESFGETAANDLADDEDVERIITLNDEFLPIRENTATTNFVTTTQLTAIGHSVKSITGGDGEPSETSRDYPVSTVEHSRLAERFGTPANPKTIETDTTTVAETTNVAEQELKKLLDKQSVGTIESKPRGIVTPYHEVLARPVCRNRTVADIPYLRFEVEEAVHRIPSPAHEGEYGLPRTEVNCSLFADPDEITTVESTMKKL